MDDMVDFWIREGLPFGHQLAIVVLSKFGKIEKS